MAEGAVAARSKRWRTNIVERETGATMGSVEQYEVLFYDVGGGRA